MYVRKQCGAVRCYVCQAGRGAEESTTLRCGHCSQTDGGLCKDVSDHRRHALEWFRHRRCGGSNGASKRDP